MSEPIPELDVEVMQMLRRIQMLSHEPMDEAIAVVRLEKIHEVVNAIIPRVERSA